MTESKYTDRAISHAITKLSDEVARNGSFEVMFDGAKVVVDKNYVKALRVANDTYLSRGSKAQKGSKKKISPESRSRNLQELSDKIDYSLQHSDGVKLSAGLRREIVNVTNAVFHARSDTPTKGTLVPRRLYFLDNHFVDFLKGISLELLGKKMESASPALRKELGEVERAYVTFLREKRVGASTLLHALISHYIKVQNLRTVKDAGSPSLIRIDDRLKQLLRAPMDSAFEKQSFASDYKPSQEEKQLKTGEMVPKIGGYRMKHPRKSVMDFILETDSKNGKYLRDGYMIGDHLMSLVSAHLIPSTCVPESDRDNLSMTMNGAHYENTYVYNLIALQAMISSSQVHGPREEAPVRSPSRSPSRSSRTPTRSTSPGRGR